jgi:hypothetical protein
MPTGSSDLCHDYSTQYSFLILQQYHVNNQLPVFAISKKFLPALFLMSISICAQAQKAKTHTMTTEESKVAKKDAGTFFNSGNYSSALKGYQELAKEDPNNAEVNYRLGICYLQTNVDKTKAIDCFESVAKSKSPRKETSYFLGLAYMYAGRWDDAIKSFEEYKVSTHSKPIIDFLDVERQLEMCATAKELTKNPVNVTFENPGKGINTQYTEFNPMISADGKLLVFASRRKGNMGGFIEDMGMYSSDVYYSTLKDTGWSKAKSVGATINTEWDEECVGLSADGNFMLIFLDNLDAASDIASSSLKGKSWQKSMLVEPPISGKSIETGASISLDGSTIYFASERKGTLGGNDIFMSKKKDDGSWDEPVNLGAVINTRYDEDAPFISMDGKTLYFSSKGHNSMGGYDIFRSVYDESANVWSKPVNIGYPINTADDNVFFSMTGDQKRAYISGLREGGLGDKDIYQITYNDETDHPFLCLISGTVTSESNTKVEITKAVLTNKSDGKMVMTYKPSSVGNEFILSARPGEYVMTIEGYNFQPYVADLSIPNESPLKNIEKKVTVKTGKN